MFICFTMKILTVVALISFYFVCANNAGKVEPTSEIIELLKKFDEEQKTLQRKLWFRRSHVCAYESFFYPVGDLNNKTVNEECDGTITRITCNTTVLGYSRIKTHICCDGFIDVKGDKCKPIGEESSEEDSSSEEPEDSESQEAPDGEAEDSGISQAQDSPAEGSQKQDSESRDVPDSEISQAQDSQAQDGPAEGSQKQDSESRDVPDSEISQAQGSQAQDIQSEGSQPEGSQSEGSQPEGSQSEDN